MITKDTENVAKKWLQESVIQNLIMVICSDDSPSPNDKKAIIDGDMLKNLELAVKTVNTIKEIIIKNAKNDPEMSPFEMNHIMAQIMKIEGTEQNLESETEAEND